MSAGSIILKGGPFDGAEIVGVASGRPFLCRGDPVPEGMVARYRPSREKGVYTFREYDRVIGLPTLPGEKS